MTPDAARVERARKYLNKLGGIPTVSNLAAFAEAEARVERYAQTVDDPQRAHLHYDGCPFKPWADKDDGDMPNPRPECTCAKAHLGAYWKGQHLLEHGYHEMTRRRLAEAEARTARLLEVLKEANETLTSAGWRADLGLLSRIRAALAEPKE